ncbi:hypothetical protein [Frankia sp. QA3]|uniref:hypothetical protein n=1 Tax=Frankia sp. QA3 TaxID=710111 RepID=UPI0002EEBDFB|nr:hypothetical protein [Frankia sp. QA3]
MRARRSRWAPWWAYLLVAIGLNVLRQLVWPPSRVSVVLTVGLFVAVLVVTGVVVTAVFRAFGGR